MSMIQTPTKTLVWLVQRPSHEDHADALAEAKRRTEKGCKNPSTQERLLTAIARAEAKNPPAKAKGRKSKPTPVVDRTFEVPAGYDVQWVDDIPTLVPAGMTLVRAA